MSIATEPPQRWTDQSPAVVQSGSSDAAITRALEKRFGTDKRQTPHDMGHQGAGAEAARGSMPAPSDSSARGGGGAHRAVVSAATAISGAARLAPNEVLEPHTLPPGTGPDMGETTPMQDFCGSETASWAIAGGHLSQCFIHTVLFAAVDSMFIVAAAMRLRDLLALPRPPPRALTRRQALKVGGSSLVAVYNLFMFATHLAYDYGADYQWLMYPMSCLTWSLCVVLLVLEVRYGWPTNWVCKSFWIGSGFVATLLLWSNLHDEKFMASHDMWVFMVHYLLYASMALMAVFIRESADYSSLAIDISDISLDDEHMTMSEDGSQPHKSSAADKRGARGSARQDEARDNNRRILNQIGELISDDRWLAAAALACCFIGAPIQVVQFIYAGMVIDDCAVPEGPSALVQYIAVLVALYLIEGVAAASQLILTTIVSERLGLRLRRAAFHSALNQEVLYIEHNRVEDITAIIHRHVQRVQDAVTVQVCQVVHAIIQSLVGVVFLVVLSWKLSLVALAITPVVALLMLVQSTVVQSYSRRLVEALDGVSASALEMFTSIRLVRTFAKEPAEKARFGSQVLSAYKVARHMALANGAAEGVGVLVLKLCLVLSIFYGASLVHHNDISGGILVSYSFIAMQVIMALTILPPVVADISNALHSANKVVDLIEREPVINTKGGLTLPRCDGNIEFSNVTLTLPPSSAPALLQMSFKVEAGTHAAFFGPAGSGKSVLLALIERFYEPLDGLVMLDETDLSTYEPTWLHSQMGYVSQEPVIFTTTVVENISFGTHLTKAQLEHICISLNLHADILKLPNGYDTLLGGPTTKVSSLITPSVRRRIALARVLAKDAPILLLDDPGAGLDANTRLEIFRALEGVMSGRTVISVARRPEALHRSASMVGVLHNGTLAECGSPSALAARRGLYFALLQGGPVMEGDDTSDWNMASTSVPAAAVAGAQAASASNHRISHLMDAFDEHLARCDPQQGASLDALRALVSEMRGTAQ